jgi:hypothetical protein
MDRRPNLESNHNELLHYRRHYPNTKTFHACLQHRRRRSPSPFSSAKNTKLRRGSNYVMQSFGSSSLGQKSKFVSTTDARSRREDMKNSHIPREDKKDAHSMQMIIKKEVNFTVTSELKQPSLTEKNIGTGV